MRPKPTSPSVLAPQLGARVLQPHLPLAAAGGRVAAYDLLGQGQHQPQRMLCHRLGHGLGGVDDGDAQLPGRFEIDIVQPHAMAADHPQRRGRCHQAPADPATATDEDAGHVGHLGQELILVETGCASHLAPLSSSAMA